MEGVLAEKGLIGRSLTQRLRLGKRVGQRVLNLTDFLAHNLDDFDRLQPSLTGARRSGAEGPTKSEPFWGCHCQALRDIGFGKEACFWNEAIVVTGGSKRWWRRKLRFAKELAVSLSNMYLDIGKSRMLFRNSEMIVIDIDLEMVQERYLSTNPVQNVETTFQLTRQEIELLQKTEYDVQAWCILLNDKVRFRMQWPLYPDLQVNGVPVRTFNRPGSQLLGANGRDDGPPVLNLIPKEPVGEQFEDAIARVCRCIGGGTAAENADSDSDLEVVADSVTVNLRCPWQCPICLKNYSLEDIIIDPYFNRITTMMRYCGEDVTEIDVKPDGSWRAKIENEHRDLAEWHLADGTLLVAADEDVKSNLETTKQIKQEGVSEGHTGLRIGIKKNRNGVWEVSRPEDMHTHFSGNPLQEKFEIHNHNQNVMPMSSSATGSGRDGEDYCVNQDIGGHFVFSANNGNELNSVSLNFDPTHGLNQNPCALLGDADVIVLSDSEEENEILIETVYGSDQADACGVTFSVPPPGVLDAYPEDSCFGTGGSSCPGLFNGLQDDYGMPLCPYPSGTQAGSGFQLFGTDMDVSDALVDVPHASITCPLPMNGYVLTPEATIGSATQVQDSSICCSSTDINESLVDNPLAFGRDDPSLQIFLPTQPAAASVQSDIRDQTDMLKDIRTEDWISLRLGGGDGGDSGGGHDESADANGLNSRNQFASKEGRMESLANIGVGPFF
ncbi:hypothetical protein HHK36_018248 [Tetracentron sinense]|uniref:SP-RING-type domain-containing protein n=1 Tax=Tetracentron sinense TaxID=13715 RepID=A0A834YVJ8_TETSI|nr:hypothetical protein HHK36_018248 [Tetracentron sinense]